MWLEILGVQCKYNYASVFAQGQGSQTASFPYNHFSWIAGKRLSDTEYIFFKGCKKFALYI
jgi:hypothetical protein